MNEILGSNIMTLRKAHGLTQEQLAAALGISFQAVSKWETGNSCPDISALPLLADLFSVTVDQLIGRVPLMDLPEEPEEQPTVEPEKGGQAPELSLPWPDDDSFYMVLFHGHTLIGSEVEDLREKKTRFEFQYEGPAQNIFSDFSVQVDGDVEGSVKAGTSVSCGDVGGDVDAGTGVNCGDVGKGVKAGGGVDCGDVGENVTAGGGVDCSDVGGSVSAGGNVDCSDVGGNVNAGGGVDCSDVGGSVYAGTKVDCGEVGGTVVSGGSFRGRKRGRSQARQEDHDMDLDELIDRSVEESINQSVEDSVRFGMDMSDFGVKLGNRISAAVEKLYGKMSASRQDEAQKREEAEE